MSYTKLSMRLFGNYAETIAFYFKDLKEWLSKAGTGFSIQEYLSIMLTTSLLSFLTVFIVSSFFLTLLLGQALKGLIVGFILASIAAGISFFFLLNYPKFLALSKIKRIEPFLPFALLQLSTLANAKLSPDKIIRTFSKFKEFKGVRDEMELVEKDISMFGYDVISALDRAGRRTSSKQMKELFYGMLTTLRLGSDLGSFLMDKSKEIMEEQRRRLYEFSRGLAVYIEIYLTAVVIGTIFVVILTSIFAGLGGDLSSLLLIQTLLIFIYQPLISFIFLWLVKQGSPVSAL